MIQSVYKYQISEIFSANKKVKYVIPKYQREYTWGKEAWENLYNDILENDDGHFIGSIICVNRGINALETTPLEVVDGQQRLTTISLFYAAIYSKLQQEERTDEDFITEKMNLKYRLVEKDGEGVNEPMIVLSSQNSNNEDYHAVLSEVGLMTSNKAPLRSGLRQIFRAFRYFKNKVEDLSYEKLLELLKKLNQVILVKIEVNSHSDAFILFESLNNRGVPLSAIDLIKNNVLSMIEKNGAMTIDDAYNQWLLLTENLGNDSGYQERFLRQFYDAYRWDPEIRISGFARATRSNVIKIYERLIDKNVESIFSRLLEGSKIYHNFIDPLQSDYSTEIKKSLLQLKNVGAAPVYIFLLYLFSNLKDQDETEKILKFLVKYFVRRNLTDFPFTRDLDMIFMKLVDAVRERDAITAENVIIFLKTDEYLANGETFKANLNGDLYIENLEMTRFILSSIEEKHETKEHFTDLWAKEDNRYIWTIEHIFPEGDRIPTKWIEMIADSDHDRAKEIQSQLVHKIGNLTLTGFNSNLSNSPFDQKRDKKDKNGTYIGYKNGFYLNEELQAKKAWKVEDIKERGSKLISELWKMFKMDWE